jgi:hypothetical protein
MTIGMIDMHSSKSKFDDDWKRDLEEEERLTPEEERKAEADRREEEEIRRGFDELEWARKHGEESGKAFPPTKEQIEAEARFRQRMLDELEPFDLD